MTTVLQSYPVIGKIRRGKCFRWLPKMARIDLMRVLGRATSGGLGKARNSGGVLKASYRCLGTSGGAPDDTAAAYPPPQQDSVNTREGVASAAKSYSLPPPTWSLADLKLGPTAGAEIDSPASAVLTPEEVSRLCALAHIELAREGDPKGGLDVAAVQRGVGSMLRMIEAMKRGEEGIRSAGEERNGQEEEEDEEYDGPWGGVVNWAAPMQKDVVADGGIQEQVLGAAKRTEAGFFTSPRVEDGGEERAS